MSPVRADAAERDRRVRGGRCRIGIEGRETGGAVESVAIRGTAKLDGLVHQTHPRSRRGVNEEIAVGERGRCRGQSQQARELWIGTHGDQVAPRVHPITQHADLCRGQ